jgi:hypothetical protein
VLVGPSALGSTVVEVEAVVIGAPVESPSPSPSPSPEGRPGQAQSKDNESKNDQRMGRV